MVQDGSGTRACNGLALVVSLITFLPFQRFLWEPDGRIQSYWIPLNVKGEESNNNAGEITSGSFKNLGGAFTEVRTDVTGMGEVKFKGTFMDSNDSRACFRMDARQLYLSEIEV